jgi:hypothetical protein
MKITVVCPRCETRSHLEEEMRGKRIFCPTCRHVFEVQAEEDKPPTAPSPPATPVPGQTTVTSGSVSDLVQLLPAQLAEPAPAPPRALDPRPIVPPPPKPPEPRLVRPKEPPTKKPSEPVPQARKPVEAPVVAPQQAPPDEAPLDFPGDFPGDDSPDGAAQTDGGPQEVGPGTWEAPPVRGVAMEPATALATAEKVIPVSAPGLQRGPTRGRSHWSLLIIASMGTILFGIAAIGWWTFQTRRAGNEADRFKQAEEFYAKGEYTAATEGLQKLIHDFPDSLSVNKYRFIAALSNVRGDAEEAQDPAALKLALNNAMQFLAFKLQEPMLKDYLGDLYRTFTEVAERLAKQAEQNHDSDALAQARQAWNEADKKLKPPSEVSHLETGRKLSKLFSEADRAIEVHATRETVVAAIQQRIERPSAVGVQEARALAVASGLKDDPQVKQLLLDVVTAHRESIRYVPAGTMTTPTAFEADDLASILVTPALHRPKGSASRAGVALSLARGVLYAFDAERGDLRWARRVGVDTTVLPLRLPADVITPELVLVLSSDSESIAALVAETGALVWRHRLAQPCTSEPLLVGRSLLVPTVAGQIEEIETSGGRLLGHYEIGQRLTAGGALLPGTAHAYFPGDGFCVYVLDTANRNCEALVYSQHSSGSLRGAPILVRGRPEGGPAKGPAGWMILCEANGTSAVRLRSFDVPIRDVDQEPRDTQQVRGLAWFAPYHDSDKLAFATDAGLLSLWGIHQKGNRGDPVLFRLLKDDYAVGAGSGRAQVVDADNDGYWTLGAGQLRRFKDIMRPQSGPDLASAWPQPVNLGSPLHTAQRHRDEAGQARLLLTTLGLERPTSLSTAVDAATGNIHWQRQLGCVSLHAPLAMDGQILLRDAGGLLRLDASQYADNRPWQGADDFLLREPMGPNDEAVLFPGAKEFVQLSWTKSATPKLRVRHVPLAGDSTVEEHDLPALPAGTCAAGVGFALLPLANGIVVRLGYGGTVLSGPNWRGVGVDEQAPGHLILLDADEFLMTDGAHGLARVSWPGKTYQQRAAVELSHRIVTAPAVVPGGGDARPRVVVADANDNLSLLDAERLQVLRKWHMPRGRITAGPFVQDEGIFCILDHKRIIRIEPDLDRPDPTWEYAMVADIVGAPVLVDGMLVVADVSGRILAFEPRTGRTLGGYTMRANVAPDAAPVPFGSGRLLVPLNDGTLVLLPIAKLR